MASQKDVKPTKTDRAILEFMNGGGIINWKTAFQGFGTNRLTDNIYRLRNNGTAINTTPVYYTTKDGTEKHYFNYFTKKPVIMPSGKKTGKEKV